MAKKLILEHSENGRADDHHSNRPARGNGSLLSDHRIFRQSLSRRSRQDEPDGDRTGGDTHMVAESSRAKERRRPALPSRLDDSHMPKQANHAESAAHQE